MIYRVQDNGKAVAFQIDDSNDHIFSQIIKKKSFYELDLLQDAASRYRDGLIVDVGAHRGNHSLYFGVVMGAEVLAFEPQPDNYKALVNNVRQNFAQRRIRTYPYALGDKAGYATSIPASSRTKFEDNTGMARVKYGEGDVQVVTLDSMTSRKVGLIKIDVEGNEMAVLRGAKETIKRDMPILYVECGTPHKKQQVDNFLRPLGYEPTGRFAITPTFGYQEIPEPIHLSITVMAHPARKQAAKNLAGLLDANIVWDQINDRWDTGRRALLDRDESCTHHLVIQDDAVVRSDLPAQLEDALRYVQPGSPLCLYIGKVYKFQRVWRPKIRKDTAWIRMPGLNWGVGIVMPTKDIPELIAFGDKLSISNYDLRISRFYESRKIDTWYPWPSLVDHTDGPSLVDGRTASRVAAKYDPDLFNPAGGVVVANLRR